MAAAIHERIIVANSKQCFRKKPLNIIDADFRLFAAEFDRTINESHVLKLFDVYLIDDQIIDLRRMNYFNAYTQPNSEGAMLKSLIKGVLKLFNLWKLTGKTTIIARGVWISDNWSNSYFHWLTDALPRLIAAKTLMSDHVILVPWRLKQCPFISQSLIRLNLSFQFFGPDYIIRAKELLLPSHTAPPGNYNPIIINQVRDVFSFHDRKGAFRKIFISRRKAKNRTISNEEDVIRILIRYGYEIHCFEDYSIGTQIEIMRETKSLLGLHGAGLTNMLFMKKGAEVLELRDATDDHNNCFFTLASELGINYFYLLNKGQGFGTAHAEISVDIEKLQGVLDVMCSRRSWMTKV